MEWKQRRTENYLLFYHPGSYAEQRLPAIARWQEACYQKISCRLGFGMPKTIRLYLCDSPQEIARITGCPPCNAMTFDYDLIYATFSETIQCLGPHEDAHLFSYQIAIPEAVFLKEGFAMYFDGSYHGRKNEEIVREWLKSRPDFRLSALLDNRCFEQLPEELSYPLAGAFAAWFIEKYTMDGYLEFYRSHAQAGVGLAGLTAGQEAAFVSDLNR